MGTRAAVVRGVFMRPGVSKNKRLYTKEAIAKAVGRMQEQLNSYDGLPLTMATSHGAAYQDDASSFVGRVTKVNMNPDGSASFEADIANTTQGKDVATLISGDKPFLKSISIRGEWLGNVETVDYEGQKVTTAADFNIHGIDFTSRPGVTGAQIEQVELLSEAAMGGNMIFESFEDFEIEEEFEVAIEEADGFSPPESVRAEARRALKWIADGHAGAGFTDVGRKRASDLAAGRSIGLDTIKRMNSFLARHSVDKKGKGWSPDEDGYPSPGRVAYAAWGGAPAIGWVTKILKSQVNANEAEDLATILRHDKGHDDWHRSHGDEPCTSDADCKAKAARYEAEKNSQNEATDYSKIIPKRDGEPANKDLYSKVVAAAKNKFDVYPSAVANAWVSREYKSRGGRYTSENEGINMEKIAELLSEMLVEVEEADATPYGEVRYADPGYRKDGVKRYPIDTEAHARAAWSYINQEKNASFYTSAQLARIKGRIKSAAKKFGINITEEYAEFLDDLQEVVENWVGVSVDNGSATINVNGKAMDPTQLRALIKQLAMTATAALTVLDPDQDGDIDNIDPDDNSPGANTDPNYTNDGLMSDIETDDNNMESDVTPYKDPGVATDSKVKISREMMYCPSCNQSLPDGVTNECESCGASLMACESCGCAQMEGTQECTECGASMMASESHDSQEIKEALVADTENVAEAVTDEVPEVPARSLTDADIKALAAITAEAVAAAIAGTQVKEDADSEEPEAEVAADAEPAEEPEVEAQENTQESDMAESYSADDLKKAVAEALDTFKSEVAEAYRENGAPRKGLVTTEIADEENDEAFTAESLSRMGTREFRESQYEAWGAVPFFQRLWNQADGFNQF